MKIYDNSNIAESYSGVTTPLTYSFARAVYQEVYVHFCGMMGVSRGVIRANRAMYSKMVEFIGGRLYYDLINWYKLVSFLPGYSFNRAFFEKMLGLQKEYHYAPPPQRGALARYFIFLPRLVFQTAKIGLSFLFMGTLIRRFNSRFDREYARLCELDLGELSLPACKALYFRVYNEFVARWQVPIANDFAVMVSAGAADKLYKAWLGEEGYVRLFSRAHKPLVSLDPGYRIIEIVSLIKKDGALRALFAPGNAPESILRELRGPLANTAAALKINSYLERFGSRAPNELKLESKTINEQPGFFISILQSTLASPDGGEAEEAERPDPAYELKLKALPAARRLLLAAVSSWAVTSVYQREETRFRRSLIFGFSRRLFLAIGAKFAARGFIGEKDSIFYLTLEEVFGIIDAGQAPDGLEALIAGRKQEYAFWKARELPRRIESGLSVPEIEAGLRGAAAPQVRAGPLKGVTAARTPADRVSGEALVLADFNPEADFSGKILVTRQTDPGWTIVFPLLKGIIVERGGMLSHAAIVARELRIPCIVGVERAVAGVLHGSTIEMHMDTGEVHVQA